MQKSSTSISCPWLKKKKNQVKLLDFLRHCRHFSFHKRDFPSSLLRLQKSSLFVSSLLSVPNQILDSCQLVPSCCTTHYWGFSRHRHLIAQFSCEDDIRPVFVQSAESAVPSFSHSVLNLCRVQCLPRVWDTSEIFGLVSSACVYIFTLRFAFGYRNVT